MIEEVNTQYLTELRAEKEELEKKPGENTNAIKLLHNGEKVHPRLPIFHLII